MRIPTREVHYIARVLNHGVIKIIIVQEYICVYAMASMRQLKKLLHKGSHFAVEWDEPGNPRSVVPRKDVVVDQTRKDIVGESLNDVGDVCQVRVKEGSRTVEYNAKVIGIGSKAEMTRLLDDLDEPEDSDVSTKADEEEPTQSDSPVIPIQRSRPTGQPPAKRPRKAAKSSSRKKVGDV